MRRSRGESVEHDLKFLLNAGENSNKCGECGTPFPTYCSVNLGVFLCGRCASVHRKVLGSREDGATSIVKSLSLDRWSKRDVQTVADLGGNKHNSSFWNPKKEPFPFDGDEDRTAVEMFIRDKYLKGKFRHTAVKVEDFNLEDDSSQLDYKSSRPSSASGSRRNRSASSASSRPRSREGDRPPLPKRPDNKVQEAVFDGTSEPSLPSTASAEPRPAVFDGVQQYYDPTTGQIYVDQNSYAAMQQAQVQALAQQVQPQFTQQVQPQFTQQVQPQFTQQLQPQFTQQVQPQFTAQPSIDKNTLLSLYQRPDLYSSAVEIKPDNPQYQQILNLQKQQQDQQQQQQQLLQQQQLQQQQQQQLLQQQQLQQMQYQQPQQYQQQFYPPFQ
ncbi:Gts1p [Kluyveromyces lactis]|uniref:KLLA0C17138p n=1 Tax=Kluyveromyces lactis (strain ATCC 8585 / CBS 2359 / DSM 70799 / NBRC 1267 / NRRL Y-1140 / WM37) TaxID=284590 RepID=Q6CSX3_KLULA|nr:uncharacterized protein KLLA0_C17138g [Kluyveromyces lactis]CAH01817.1 KLLA0C17138p [Kluyveromyces lactis]|eukprot:XP_452966.1 uncharacterized protein KLLA0_C17138g [Kluyveromyces lactis]